jgi:hypothetical protein
MIAVRLGFRSTINPTTDRERDRYRVKGTAGFIGELERHAL